MIFQTNLGTKPFILISVLLFAVQGLAFIHADQVTELDRYGKWILSVKDVPVTVTAVVSREPGFAEPHFYPSYQVLVITAPDGSIHELPLTEQELQLGEDDNFYKLAETRKPHFAGDWNGDTIPEVLFAVYNCGIGIHSGKNKYIDDITKFFKVEYLLIFDTKKFQLVGFFNIEDNDDSADSDVYGLTVPQPESAWPVLYHWSAKPLELNRKSWSINKYVFEDTKYKKVQSWEADGGADNARSLLSKAVANNKITDASCPLAYLWDDKVYLRQEANRTSRSLGLLSKNNLLYLLDVFGPAVTIENYRGPWFKVLVLTGPLKGKEGWVFGGFLAPAESYFSNKAPLSLEQISRLQPAESEPGNLLYQGFPYLIYVMGSSTRFEINMHTLQGIIIPSVTRLDVFFKNNCIFKKNFSEQTVVHNFSVPLDVANRTLDYGDITYTFRCYQDNEKDYYDFVSNFKMISNEFKQLITKVSRMHGGISDSIPALLEKYGKPNTMTVKDRRNKYYQNKMDKLYEIRYDGMELEITEINNEGWKPFLFYTRQHITDSRFELAYGVRVGMEYEEFSKIFSLDVLLKKIEAGEYTYKVFVTKESATETVVYFDSNYMNEGIWFYFINNKLDKVESKYQQE